MLRFLFRCLTGAPCAIDEALFLIHFIAKEIRTMSTQLAALQAQVAENTTVIGSALTLIQGLRAQLDAAGTDPAALAALSASLKATDDALAAAVAANTTAAPTPAAAPAVAASDVPPVTPAADAPTT